MIGLGEILAGLNILEKLSKYRSTMKGKQTSKESSVAYRFIRLFEGHGVHRNQIPRFFGHGLTVKDVQDDSALLQKLDETLLDEACRLFAVRREWLDGADPRVYDGHDFYKRFSEIEGFLKTLVEENPDGGLDGIVFMPIEQMGDSLVILSEAVGVLGGKAIYRYHLCNNWLFEYWKSRAYLTSFVATAWRHKVYLRGLVASKREIARIANGMELLGSFDGVLSIQSIGKWYPEDMALRPEAFLNGIDPERNMFGVAAALELWLSLEKDGYLATGISTYQRDEIRRNFELELDKVRAKA